MTGIPSGLTHLLEQIQIVETNGRLSFYSQLSRLILTDLLTDLLVTVEVVMSFKNQI